MILASEILKNREEGRGKGEGERKRGKGEITAIPISCLVASERN